MPDDFCPTCGAANDQPCTVRAGDLARDGRLLGYGERHPAREGRTTPDSPADYAFGGDLFHCPDPYRLAELHAEAMGWTDVRVHRPLTSGMGVSVAYTDRDGTRQRYCVGCFALQDFAAGR